MLIWARQQTEGGYDQQLPLYIVRLATRAWPMNTPLRHTSPHTEITGSAGEVKLHCAHSLQMGKHPLIT